jgi:hypothetical protein
MAWPYRLPSRSRSWAELDGLNPCSYPDIGGEHEVVDRIVSAPACNAHRALLRRGRTVDGFLERGIGPSPIQRPGRLSRYMHVG